MQNDLGVFKICKIKKWPNFFVTPVCLTKYSSVTVMYKCTVHMNK